MIFFVILILIFDRDQRIRCFGRFPCWAKNVSWKKENEPEKKRRRERWTGIISRNEYITKPTALIINQQFILANWAQSPLGSEVSIEAGVQRSAAAYRGSSTPALVFWVSPYSPFSEHSLLLNRWHPPMEKVILASCKFRTIIICHSLSSFVSVWFKRNKSGCWWS